MTLPNDNNNEKSRNDLTKAIQAYRDNRERLIKIQASTKEAFSQITAILEQTTSELLGCVNVDNLADIPNELGALKNEHLVLDGNNPTISIVSQNPSFGKIEIENPAVAIIGQVKAGKSTFINVLLRKNVVCQAFERCTARLIRLQYSQKNFVQIEDRNGNVLEKKMLKDSVIPKRFVQLNEKDRNDVGEITKQVRAGVNAKFLESGIDIIDTPGLSENDTLDTLAKNIVKNMLPVMIYVIDGRTSVKQTDITYLTELKNTLKNLQIIYFITKLDTDDPSENLEKDTIEMAENKLEVAFKKLQYNHLIPNTYKHWSDCPNFHGASLYAYMDYFKNKITPETNYHFQKFAKFEKALHNFLVERFEYKINDVCNTLINFHMDVLTKIIRRAQALADYRRENMKQIFTIQKIEEELFEKIKGVIMSSKQDLIERLVKRLQDEKDAIINPISDLEYPAAIAVPDDGLVKDIGVVKQCQNKIMFMLCQGFESIIKQFVEEELFQKYREAIEAQVTNRMKDEMGCQQAKFQGKSPYRMTLERLLASKYKFTDLSGLSDYEGRSAIAKFMDSILESLKSFFRVLFRTNNTQETVDVKHPEWKLQQARDCLAKVDQYQLAEEVCKNLLEDFEDKHNGFLMALEFEYSFVQKDIVLSEETRLKVALKAPDFAGLLMLTLDVKGRYLLQSCQDVEKIGQGAQGEVFHCIVNGRHLAKKTSTLPIDQLNGIAEEVYYSYLFKHPRMLPMEAVSIEETNDFDTKKISVYSPLLKTDVSKYLKKQANIPFETRMKIGVQVAEALQYLHDQKIMHRDLKLANILLDDENNVYLADYGFCKSMALTAHSFVGTPVHIAPEIVRKEIYDHKVDIFSFGILLWYLAEGSGRHPRFARVQSNIAQVLWASTEHNMRPEKLQEIPDDMWQLMQSCWDNDPAIRPDINYVITEMERILKRYTK